jgi:hypothetical protein
MRAYFFGNFYLSSIQQGIQAGHCLGQMVVEYGCKPNGADTMGFVQRTEHYAEQATALATFLTKHKTFILLNGGAQTDLQELYMIIKRGELDEQHQFPYAYFNEEKDALNESITCVGIVLPKRIYEFSDLLKKDDGTLRHVIEEQLNRRGFAYYNREDPESLIESRWQYDFAQLLTTYRLAS